MVHQAKGREIIYQNMCILIDEDDSTFSFCLFVFFFFLFVHPPSVRHGSPVENQKGTERGKGERGAAQIPTVVPVPRGG